MNYEKNAKELEQIIKKLSEEKIGVEEGLNLYEQGLKLAKESIKELNEAKGKMEILNKELEKLQVETEVDDDWFLS